MGLINNIELKCSFVRCRKYHKSWSNGAAEPHISVDLLCGTTAAELHTCVRLTSITFSVIWSSVLISVTREGCYSGLIYKFFVINNIELKCSFVRCRKSQVMVKWRRRASHLGRFTLWHNCCRAAQLVNLFCDKTAAELHNSVNLLCGITAAELNPV